MSATENAFIAERFAAYDSLCAEQRKHIEALRARCEALEAALRNCFDGWAKSEDVVTPMQAARRLLAERDET